MNDPLLTVQDLTVEYGPVRALSDISLTVEPGEIFVIMGLNGAGKSSLLKTISGLVRPLQGNIFLDGAPIETAQPWDVAKRGLGHVPEGRRCFGPLSVEDNLRIGALAASTSGVRFTEVYEMFPVLYDKRNDASSTLSGGQQQMLAIGRGLMANPRLLMLDEPSLGLAPIIVQQLRETLREISTRFGASMMVAEQNLSMALPIATRGAVLTRGRITATGKGESLRSTVEDAYLGR